jgi:hypothetical protein
MFDLNIGDSNAPALMFWIGIVGGSSVDSHHNSSAADWGKSCLSIAIRLLTVSSAQKLFAISRINRELPIEPEPDVATNSIRKVRKTGPIWI